MVKFKVDFASDMFDKDNCTPELTGAGLPKRIADHVTIEEQGQRRSAKFRTVFCSHRITVNDLEEFPFRAAPSCQTRSG